MKKKKSSGGGANWMDTYGDMVTLLLCFFVLLYSMSTISEEKWRAIMTSFNPFAIQDATDPEGNDGPVADPDDGQGGVPSIPDVTAQHEVDEDMEELYIAIQNFIAQQGVTESVSVSKDGGKIFVSFNGTAFFQADTYDLTAAALPVLDSMGEMLSRVARSIDEVRVIGHTAQHTPGKLNNPETDFRLSGERASKVVSYIIMNTRDDVLDPAKFRSEGAGQWQPVAPNDTEEGRAKNRRVEMIISGRDLEKELGSGEMESYTTE